MDQLEPPVFTRGLFVSGIAALVALPILTAFASLFVPFVPQYGPPVLQWLSLIDAELVVALFMASLSREFRTSRRTLEVALASVALVLVLAFPFGLLFQAFGGSQGDSYSGTEQLGFAVRGISLAAQGLLVPAVALVVAGVACRLARRSPDAIRGLAITAWVFAAIQFSVTTIVGLNSVQVDFVLADISGIHSAGETASALLVAMRVTAIALPLALVVLPLIFFRRPVTLREISTGSIRGRE